MSENWLENPKRDIVLLVKETISELDEIAEKNEYARLVMVRHPLHDNVWFMVTGVQALSKVKYGQVMR